MPRGSDVVSARWMFFWKVDKAGYAMKPKARLAAREFSQGHTVVSSLPQRRCALRMRWMLLLDVTGSYDS